MRESSEHSLVRLESMVERSLSERRSVYQAAIEYCSTVSSAVASCGYVVLALVYEDGVMEHRSSAAAAPRRQDQATAASANGERRILTIFETVALRANCGMSFVYYRARASACTEMAMRLLMHEGAEGGSGSLGGALQLSRADTLGRQRHPVNTVRMG